MAYPFKQAHRGNYTPRQGWSREIRYIVVHYTANSGDTAQNNLDYFAREVTGTSAHYFVDHTGVGQSVLDTDVAWHCGSSRPVHPECRNSNSIGVEMCDSAGAVPAAVRSRTAALVGELMSRYGVPPERVLRHYDVTGKRCPAPWVDVPGEWGEFRKMLEGENCVTQEQFDAMLEDYLTRRNSRAQEDWARPYIQEALQAGVMADAGGTIAAPLGFVTRQELATVAAALCRRDSELMGRTER